jgi:2-keto-3-deoxy-L-fuconate dehydrogenase
LSKLTGKRAVVTGAGSGIGLAIAKAFAAAGAEVFLLDLDRGKLQNIVETLELSPNGPRPQIIACDVSNEDSVASGAATKPEVDILVNCAGIAHVGSLLSTSAADLDRLYAVNVRGTFLCMRAFLPGMLKRGAGSILNLASIAATRGLSDRLAYSMTKGAVLSMTLSVAKDYVADGIRCNCISPARVHTPFVDGFLRANYPDRQEEKMKELAATQPIGRMGMPEEIAQLALFLSSPDAAFITGCDYPIDGGFMNLR